MPPPSPRPPPRPWHLRLPPASIYKCGIIGSPEIVKTWTQYDLSEFGPRSGCRINKKNTDGWFRMDLRKGWIERAEVLFLKPKPAAKP